MTSPTMLCLVLYSVRESFHMAIASMQRALREGNSLAFWKQKS